MTRALANIANYSKPPRNRGGTDACGPCLRDSRLDGTFPD